MKKSLVFAIATALAMSASGSAVCFILKWIYWDLFKFPIGLGGGLYFLLAAPRIFLASIFYAGIVWFTLSKRAIVEIKYWIRALVLGIAGIVFTLAIIFPCDAAPHFMGGYLLNVLLRR